MSIKERANVSVVQRSRPEDDSILFCCKNFSPIPETPCWEELKQKGIITDDMDPLLTNNTVFTFLFSDYDLTALEKLRLDVKEYNNL